MRSLSFSTALRFLLAIAGTFGFAVIASSSSCGQPDPVPLRNMACVFGRQLNIENPDIQELRTGWGFLPDMCSIQGAAMQGSGSAAVRVPYVVYWISVGVGEPAYKAYDLRPKK